MGNTCSGSTSNQAASSSNRFFSPFYVREAGPGDKTSVPSRNTSSVPWMGEGSNSDYNVCQSSETNSYIPFIPSSAAPARNIRDADNYYCCIYSATDTNQSILPLSLCCCTAPNSSSLYGNTQLQQHSPSKGVSEELRRARQFKETGKLVQAAEAYKSALGLSLSLPHTFKRDSCPGGGRREFEAETGGDHGGVEMVVIDEGLWHGETASKRQESVKEGGPGLANNSQNTTAYASEASSCLHSGDVTLANPTPLPTVRKKSSTQSSLSLHSTAPRNAINSSSSAEVSQPTSSSFACFSSSSSSSSSTSSPFSSYSSFLSSSSCSAGDVDDVPLDTSGVGSNKEAAGMCDELGEIYLLLKRPTDSLRWYNRAIQLEPSSPQHIYKKGVVLQLEGRFQEAIHQFSLALQIEPAYEAALFNLGTAYLAIGQPVNALKAFESFVRLDVNSGEVLCLISQCYEQQGKLVEAVAYLHRALELDPSNFAVRRSMKALAKTIAGAEGINMGGRRGQGYSVVTGEIC